MIYQSVDDITRARTRKVKCVGCGCMFDLDRRTRSAHCPECRKDRKREMRRLQYERQKECDGQDTVTGWYALVAAVIGCAVIDVTRKCGWDGQRVRPTTRSEARLWLRTTGAEWVEMLGGDTRLIQRIVVANPCAEQPELEGV